jgi:Ca-activated chloride channel homolog
MSSLEFAVPAYLVLLALVAAALGYLLVARERARAALLQSFGEETLVEQSSPAIRARRRALPDYLSLGAVVLGIAALARPQLGERPSSMARSGRDLLVVLDLSRSMNAAQGEEPRLARAKQLVNDLLTAAPGHRAGLVVFGGSAFLQLPLTSNYSAFRRFLAAASTDDIGDPATDLSRALTAAAIAFEHEGERGYQSVLLISDGESGPGDLRPALTRLKKGHIPVLAVGIGSEEGAPIPADSSEAPEKWHRDHIGRIVLSRLE